MKTRAVFFLALAGLLLRLLWLGDMEWKDDQRQTARAIAELDWFPRSPFAGVSHHSGVSHSSLSVHFMKLLSFGGQTPLAIARGVAVFNAVTIALALWLARRSPRHFAALVACATSLTLILYSRKVWTPDLQAGWICLGLGFLASALERIRDRWAGARLFGAAFCFVAAGHMYLPGALVAGVCTLAVAWTLWRGREHKALKSWLVGCGVAWSSFIPYAVATLLRTRETFASAPRPPREYNLTLAWKLGSSALTVPAPWTVHSHFFREPLLALGKMNHEADQLVGNGLILMTGLVWTLLFWFALTQLWKRRKKAGEDPLLLSALALLGLVPVILFVSRLGHYTHYWLPVLPLSFYVVAWATSEKPALRRVYWIACVFSLAAIFHFQTLIHRMGTLPGEYGTPYRLEANALGPEP